MKLVTRTTVKQVEEDIETVLDDSEKEVEVESCVEVKEITLDSSYTFTTASEKGAKGIRIISKNLVRLSFTCQGTTYTYPLYFNDITLFGGQFLDDGSSTQIPASIGYHGSITITKATNVPGITPTDDNRVKIIYYY